MGDVNGRDLERQWKGTGDLKDEVAYLHALEGLGKTNRESIRAAALFGHPAAREVLKDPSCPDLRNVNSLQALHDWFAELEKYIKRREGQLRFSFPVIHKGMKFLKEGLREDQGGKFLQSVELSIFSLTFHTGSQVESVDSSLREYATTRPPIEGLSYWTEGEYLHLTSNLSMVYVLRNLVRMYRDDRFHLAQLYIRCASAFRASEEVGREEQYVMFREDIMKELCPWLLGYGDPLWDRVKKRLKEQFSDEVLDVILEETRDRLNLPS